MILVLGHKGMLGNCVHRYLSQYFHKIDTIEHRFPSPEFIDYVSNYEGYIVNCIGAIPQKTDDFTINVELTSLLTDVKARVIHPGTDCESDDSDYGLSKRMASNFAKKSQNTKIIKASIIGHEIDTHYGLLEWFLSQKSANGYERAMWNGITTLEWAHWCKNLITNWDYFPKETILSSDCISKYELLHIMGEVFGHDIPIQPIDKGMDKCLNGLFTKDIRQQLIELKGFYDNSVEYRI